MKPLKASHILLLIALALFTAAYLSARNVDDQNINLEDYKLEQSFALNQQQDVQITLSYEDIHLITQDVDSFQITYEGKIYTIEDSSDTPVIMEEKDNTIIIKKNDMYSIENKINGIAKLWNFIRNFDGYVNENAQLTVIIPSKYSHNLNVSNSSGNIDLSDFEGDQVTIAVSSGNIRVDNSSSTSMNLISSSGRKTLNKVLSDTLILTGSSGNIIIEETTSNTIEVYSSSGSISIEGSYQNAIIGSSSGNIQFETDTLAGQYKLSSTSGKINIDVPDDSAFKIESNTNSGNFKSNIDLNYDHLDDSNAQAYYMDNNASPSIYLTSTSGNQNLK